MHTYIYTHIYICIGNILDIIFNISIVINHSTWFLGDTGSHSATKLCRWTKSMLQGKGGCYKHTFYGIASHQCMEHTPNVSCANKCIFCWRNHINPVALDWKFDTDDPEEILEESLRKHYATIEKQCLSPNALEHRKAEARQVRHCALSLVGEPVAGSWFQTF